MSASATVPARLSLGQRLHKHLGLLTFSTITAAAGGGCLYAYKTIYEPRWEYQRVQAKRAADPPPLRRSPLFIAGNEPVTDLAAVSVSTHTQPLSVDLRSSTAATSSSTTPSPSTRTASSSSSSVTDAQSESSANEVSSNDGPSTSASTATVAMVTVSPGGAAAAGALTTWESMGQSLRKLCFYAHVAWRLVIFTTRALPAAWYLTLHLTLGTCPIEVVYDEVVELFAFMGPSFVKLGQWVATRPDLFPKALCQRLELLFDSAPPHSWDATRRALAKAGVLQHVCEIEPEPLNSGSVAQVHRAKLRDDYLLSAEALADPGTRAAFDLNDDDILGADGNVRPGLLNKSAPPKVQNTNPSADVLSSNSAVDHDSDRTAAVLVPAGADVVLKVMHPGVRQLLLADLCVLRLLVGVVCAAVPGAQYFSLEQSVQEFAAMLLSQLDFEREADNLVHFAFNFRGPEHGSIIFPKPLVDLSTKEVLVETFEPGVPLNSDAASAIMKGNKDLGRMAVRMFMKMIFEDNLVHADLHPGNMLCRYRLPDGRTVATIADLYAEKLRQQNKKKAMKSTSSTASTSTSTASTSPLLEEPLPQPTAALQALASKLTPAEVKRFMKETGAKLELVILDPGLVTSLGESERSNFVELFACVASGDGKRGAQLMLERAPEHSCVDEARFRTDMAAIFDVVSPTAGRKGRAPVDPTAPISAAKATELGGGADGRGAPVTSTASTSSTETNAMISELTQGAEAEKAAMKTNGTSSNDRLRHHYGKTVAPASVPGQGAVVQDFLPVTEHIRHPTIEALDAPVNLSLQQGHHQVHSTVASSPSSTTSSAAVQSSTSASPTEASAAAATSGGSGSNGSGYTGLLSPHAKKPVGGFILSDVDVGAVLHDILAVMREHRVRIDMNFATLVATVVVGEGMGRKMVPDFNLFEEAVPFLLKCLRSQELAYLAEKLQETYLTSSTSTGF